jgi:hypothetical protein
MQRASIAVLISSKPALTLQSTQPACSYAAQCDYFLKEPGQAHLTPKAETFGITEQYSRFQFASLKISGNESRKCSSHGLLTILSSSSLRSSAIMTNEPPAFAFSSQSSARIAGRCRIRRFGWVGDSVPRCSIQKWPSSTFFFKRVAGQSLKMNTRKVTKPCKSIEQS